MFNAKLAKVLLILKLTLRAATNVARTVRRTRRMRHVSLREPKGTTLAASHIAQLKDPSAIPPTERLWAHARSTQPLFGTQVPRVAANATVLAS